MSTALCNLAQRFGTDKANGGYTLFYHSLLGGRRNEIKKVLEVGIGTVSTMSHVPRYKPGASLRMWEAYFQNAQIYGLDINPHVIFNEGRIQTKQCNTRDAASVKAAIEWMGGNFDLIIDDGDHDPDAQIFTMEGLIRQLSPEGIYIVEDAEYGAAISEAIGWAHAVVNFAKPRTDKLVLVYP